jgi:hypothetical protein
LKQTIFVSGVIRTIDQDITADELLTAFQNGQVSWAATTASQIPTGVSIPQWQRWYGQNLGKTIFANGQLLTIGRDLTADQLLNAYANDQLLWTEN